MIGAMEAVHSGTTTLCDDTNVAPRINQEHVDAVFQAYEDLGIRAYVGPTLFDRPFFRAVPFVDEEFPEGPAGRTRRHADVFLRRPLGVREADRARASPEREARRLHRGALGAAALHRGVHHARCGAWPTTWTCR